MKTKAYIQVAEDKVAVIQALDRPECRVVTQDNAGCFAWGITHWTPEGLEFDELEDEAVLQLLAEDQVAVRMACDGSGGYVLVKK